jgi:hypothetical protein
MDIPQNSKLMTRSPFTNPCWFEDLCLLKDLLPVENPQPEIDFGGFPARSHSGATTPMKKSKRANMFLIFIAVLPLRIRFRAPIRRHYG